MKKLLLAGLLSVAGQTVLPAQTVPAWPEARREAGAGCRWWWLGSAVDEENLKWNLEQMSMMGIRNLEITPIYGVKGNTAKNIAFLSEKWLDMLRYCREQGCGIDIDMATGTGWPFGGPMVKREESASKLVTEVFDITADGTKAQTTKLNTGSGKLQCVMAFPQKDTEGVVTDLTALVSGNSVTWTPMAAGKWKLIAAYCQPGIMQVKRPSPGSEGLVIDHFDSIAVAHYLEWFDQKFEAGGNVFPHSFFNDSYEINQADWTPTLFTEFERRRGYRLQEYIDLLAGVSGTQREGVTTTAQISNLKSQIYSDYRLTLAEMLRDNFTRQWTAWAHRHGATTRNQAHGSPGNLIDLYAEADIPETENFYMNSFGIRGLRDDKGFYNTALSSRATLKYASSAAHITGKQLTSSESMTWLTEHFRTSLSQIKPELDFLFTSGVNHVLFHGAAYSPKDAPWPGWKFYAAIDMSPTNSFWPDAWYMMRYIERVQSFLQMGRPDNDVLVYAPFANAWRKTTGSFANRLLLFDINTMDKKMPELEQCVNSLETLGLDCDYTSERFLMTTTFTDGQLQTAAGTRYQALIIPVSDNIPDSVKVHLDDLTAQGATIVYGRTVADLAALTIAHSASSAATVADGFAACTPEALRTQLGLSVIRRANDTGHHYFIANLTPDDAEGYVPLAVAFADAAFFDPMTGDITLADIDSEGRVWLSLKSGQSVILQTYDKALAQNNNGEIANNKPVTELAAIEIGDSWTFRFDDANLIETVYQMESPRTWETLSDAGASYMGTGIYETMFTITEQQLATATAGFRLDLGDVRESARVWLNGQFIGCAWAVPFVIDCQGLIRKGTNTLMVDVTNLPANRIRQMDIDGTEWRIFEDANIANISSADYKGWSLVPSGLNSKVKLIPLARQANSLTAPMSGMVKRGDFYYPQFTILAAERYEAGSYRMKDQTGAAFTGYDIYTAADGSATLTVTGNAGGRTILEATATDGTTAYAYLPAYGPYDRTTAIDLTAEGAEPIGGWQKLASTSEIKGFSAMGKLPWNRSKSNGKEVTLYDGLTFESTKSNYYFFFPGYGMNAPNDFTVHVDEPSLGGILATAYLRGTGNDNYVAADSLLLFTLCEDTAQPMTQQLYGNSSMTIYRSMSLFKPTSNSVGISDILADERTGSGSDDHYYTLQGVRVEKPVRGLYIHRGRIEIVK